MFSRKNLVKVNIELVENLNSLVLGIDENVLNVERVEFEKLVFSEIFIDLVVVSGNFDIFVDGEENYKFIYILNEFIGVLVVVDNLCDLGEVVVNCFDVENFSYVKEEK